MNAPESAEDYRRRVLTVTSIAGMRGVVVLRHSDGSGFTVCRWGWTTEVATLDEVIDLLRRQGITV